MSRKVSVFVNLFGFPQDHMFIHFVSLEIHLIYFVVVYANVFLFVCMKNLLSSPSWGSPSPLCISRGSHNGSKCISLGQFVKTGV